MVFCGSARDQILHRSVADARLGITTGLGAPVYCPSHWIFHRVFSGKHVSFESVKSSTSALGGFVQHVCGHTDNNKYITKQPLHTMWTNSSNTGKRRETLPARYHIDNFSISRRRTRKLWLTHYAVPWTFLTPLSRRQQQQSSFHPLMLQKTQFRFSGRLR